MFTAQYLDNGDCDTREETEPALMWSGFRGDVVAFVLQKTSGNFVGTTGQDGGRARSRRNLNQRAGNRPSGVWRDNTTTRSRHPSQGEGMAHVG